MRQSSQLPARGGKRFYTIDPDQMSKERMFSNNGTSEQYMGRGRKSVNRDQTSQNSTGSHNNLQNLRVSIANPFAATADLNRYVGSNTGAQISKETRTGQKMMQKTPNSVADGKRFTGNAYAQNHYRNSKPANTQ